MGQPGSTPGPGRRGGGARRRADPASRGRSRSRVAVRARAGVPALHPGFGPRAAVGLRDLGRHAPALHARPAPQLGRSRAARAAGAHASGELRELARRARLRAVARAPHGQVLPAAVGGRVGNTPRARARQRRLSGATLRPTAAAMRTSTTARPPAMRSAGPPRVAATALADVATVGGRAPRTATDSPTCSATWPNGSRIARAAATSAARRTRAPGCGSVAAASACCAAAAGPRTRRGRAAAAVPAAETLRADTIGFRVAVDLDERAARGEVR